jgi:hypothetical protein
LTTPLSAADRNGGDSRTGGGGEERVLRSGEEIGE